MKITHEMTDDEVRRACAWFIGNEIGERVPPERLSLVIGESPNGDPTVTVVYVEERAVPDR